jgi:hypothetical protein
MSAKKIRIPTVGENEAQMAAMRRDVLVGGQPVSMATRRAMVAAEMRSPSFERHGRPRPGLVEVSYGVYQDRGEHAKLLRRTRALARTKKHLKTARDRNLYARVVAGRTVQAGFQRRR